MKSFPTDIRFKYPWRKYQQRVLDELESHLQDDHLHVVAPPGSGKTVLGLEVVLRLNNPALILAPTITIRNQWILRFCELFLQSTEIPAWVSKDIRVPSFLTVSTYQGLHAALGPLEKNANFSDKVIGALQKEGVKTIVVDEAHHLQNEWWKSINQVKKSLNAHIVGLTATPPYDVSHQEWLRYLDLNGPVDTEITVPELVVEGDLCPHQDFIHISYPTPREYRKIIEFRHQVNQAVEEIKNDKTILNFLVNHPVFINPKENLEWIYGQVEYYSALLIFLNYHQLEISKAHLKIIGNENKQLPGLNHEWLEILLTFYLFDQQESGDIYSDHRKGLLQKLRRIGALEKKRISFINNNRINQSLRSSISKLQSIADIVDFEYANLKKGLRMVILSDFIRKEYLSPHTEISKIGVVPIFEKLRRINPVMRLGILTGSLIVIPKVALNTFEGEALRSGLPTPQTEVLGYDHNYLVLKLTTGIKHNVVQMVTNVFQLGEIDVLIGTKSLLGEGWDAPSINALVLASYIGSFVLSNQMRGRAIRVNNNDAQKTGNIWHLACADTTLPGGGEDLSLLARRFKAFVGIPLISGLGIENGIRRMNLPPGFSTEAIEYYNRGTFGQATKRGELEERWHQALKVGVNLVEEIKIPFRENKGYKKVKKLHLNKTIAYVFAELMAGLLTFSGQILQSFLKSARSFESWEKLYWWLFSIGITGMIYFGAQIFRSLRLYLKYRDIAKDVRRIGIALLHALAENGIIKSNTQDLNVAASSGESGSVYCHLDGGSTFEKSVFIQSLQEIVDPIENPRYLIVRKHKLFRIINQKDFHAVPDVLGRKKEIALSFQKHWKKWVGPCALIFTRNIEGRKLMLRARIHSLASEFQEGSERVNVWK